MENVKTYDKVNREDNSPNFRIVKMEDIYAQRNGKADVPHRHNYFTVVFTLKAQGKHYIDFNEYDLKEGQVFFLSPGQVHQIVEEKESQGFVIAFSNQFLISNNIPLLFIENLNLFHDFGQSPPLILKKQSHQKVISFLEEIFLIYPKDDAFKNEAIGALLNLILIECNRSVNVDTESLKEKNSTLNEFKKLINQHYKEWHGTAEYANQLNISPDHLNRIAKSQTGKTAKEHIQSRIIVAAKRLLYFTDFSGKEIGYELGFSEPANFSAFFKNNVGISPSIFKAKA